MNDLLQARITTTDLSCTQSRYEELRKAENSHNRMTVWQKDKAIAQIALLTGQQAVHHVAAAGGDFFSGEDCLKSSQITCTFLAETKAFIGNGKKDDGSRESFPDVLYTSEPVDIPAHTVQAVWVEIAVPADCAPGLYKGAVVVTADGLDEAITLPLQVEVLGIAAPSPQEYAFDIELWQYPYRVAQYYGLEPFCEAHLAVLREHLARYRDLGGHAITASIVEEPWKGQTYGEYPSMIKWRRKADKTFAFDFTEFDQWVGLNHSLGIGDKIVCYSLIPWGNKITYFDEKKGRVKTTAPRTGTGKYKKVWRQFLRALVDHADEKGWFDQLYIGIDERRAMKKAYDLIDSVKNKDGKILKKSAAMDHFNAKFFPLIDRMTSVSVGSEPLKGAKEDYRQLTRRRSLHPELKTTVYTCVGHFPNSFTYSMPAEGYWTILFSAAMGANGYLRWAYDAWVKDPLRDTTHVSFESGDCFLVYPDEADAAHPRTKSSVRLEKLAQGMRDINKLLFLSQQSESMKQKAQAILDRVKDDYTQNKDQVAVAVATEETRRRMPEEMDGLRGAIAALTRDYLKAEN